ncbi:hypothetical protein T4A_5455 [Trichinella pseudospiralis]|uniref:Uncharacterized protein n=1 Tax=Trichinella pseudospiralis TaxID=6337 RepID=A0A0V1EEY4_TRIPS|nr:hypothetical protein T4A_5455 [Trichinella pseudospiralis]
MWHFIFPKAIFHLSFTCSIYLSLEDDCDVQLPNIN